ncbi:MAG: DNA-formamidopyrimidine glycosylase family protein [Spirochaetaceae bacterium]
MPELPDVEVFRRYLDRHIGGARITAVEVADAQCPRCGGRIRSRVLSLLRPLTWKP